MLVAGERAELRGLNLEGLRRRGFTYAEVRIKVEFDFHGLKL
jgi:UDP-N-acetylglucosamine acyltransferase